MPFKIGGEERSALLDTGATVSTIKQSLAGWLGLHILPVTEMLGIECANGQSLPYVGYAVTDLALPGRTKQIDCMFLVVPDLSHSKAVPILVGTNNLERLLSTCESSPLPEPLCKVQQCLQMRKEVLDRRNGVIAVLSYVGPPVEIRPGAWIELPLQSSMCADHPMTHALVEGIPGASESSPLDIAPSLHVFGSSAPIQVSIRNAASHPVRISSGSKVAQLTPVVVASLSQSEQVLPDVKNTMVSPEDREGLEALIQQYADVFSQHDLDLGHYNGVKHRIELLDEHPFKQRYRRIPPHMFEEVSDHLRQLEASGVIRPSKSPFSSPIVCCRKKDGSLRLCVDYRLLNQRTKKDNYCLPRIEDILDSLNGSCYFSRLDLKSGYHHIEIEEGHKERTAFTVGPLGFYEHNRLAFGLCNSPATFQRVMEDCFADVHLRDMYVYIDDIIVFSSTVEEHMQKLERIFERLRQCGLKLAPKKCELLQQEISFLGFHVSKNGVHTDPEKITKVREWKTPQNSKELASFLGFAGYYRKFVKGFSQIALPLSQLKNEPKSK